MKTLPVLLVIGISIAFLFRNKINTLLKANTAKTRIDNYLLERIQNGDIIFHTSKSSQSKAVQISTNSKYSHMGIIYKTGDELYVYEAVQPVKLTKFDKWIERGEHGHYVIKRLKNTREILNKNNLNKMRTIGQKYQGKDYDLYFEWSDDKIYCSELVWKIYKEALNIELGELQELRDFNLSNDIVKKKMKERYGKNIPFNEKVISPSAIFESDKLEIVSF